MDRKPLSLPEIALIAGTRAALGAGVGLLLADKLTEERRRGIGWALLGVGVLTTIPIVAQLASQGRHIGTTRRSELPKPKQRTQKRSVRSATTA